MAQNYRHIVFSDAAKALQEQHGSRISYAKLDTRPVGEIDVLTAKEIDYIALRDSFYMATVSETGWPYLQHRGGPRGFLKVLDDKTLAFADYAGNRQLISVGNLATNDRVALIMVDYAHRTRLKLLGRLQVQELSAGDPLVETLVDPTYRARAQRAMIITVQGFDWNCPQHIPMRLDAEDIQRALDERDARIAELESQLSERGDPRRTR